MFELLAQDGSPRRQIWKTQSEATQDGPVYCGRDAPLLSYPTEVANYELQVEAFHVALQRKSVDTLSHARKCWDKIEDRTRFIDLRNAGLRPVFHLRM